jgi:U3 small nucleolar RNA-associated protein 13
MHEHPVIVLDVALDLQVEISETTNTLVTELEGSIKLVQWDSQTSVDSLVPENEEEEQQSVSTFCLSPNGKEIVVATTRFSIAHWHVDSKQCQRTIKAHRMPILAMDFDPSSTLVATGSADHTVKVWDILKGYCTHSFTTHSDIVKVVRFHPDQDKLTLFSSSDDNSICMYDLRSSQCVAQFRDHVSLPSCLTLTSDGGILVSSGRDKVLNCYDLRTHGLLKTIPVMEELESVVALNPEASRAIVFGCGISLKKQTSLVNVIVTGGEKGTLQFSVITMAGHDLSTFTFTYLFQLPVSSVVSAATMPEDIVKLKSISRLTYLPTSKELVAFTNDFNICVYDLNTIAAQAGALVDNSRKWLSPNRVLIGSHGDILDMVRVPNCAYDVALVTNSPQLRFMNRRFECQVLEGHQDIVLTIDISDDG